MSNDTSTVEFIKKLDFVQNVLKFAKLWKPMQ